MKKLIWTFLLSFLSRIQKNVIANWALTEINKNSKQFEILRLLSILDDYS